MLFFDQRELVCPVCFPRVRFTPSQTHRLWPSSRLREKFCYQDLMTGACTACGRVVFAWLGIDLQMHVENYYAIPLRRHAVWKQRIRDASADRPNGYGVNLVCGSVREKNSGRFIFRPSIPVR